MSNVKEFPVQDGVNSLLHCSPGCSVSMVVCKVSFTVIGYFNITQFSSTGDDIKLDRYKGSVGAASLKRCCSASTG